MDLINDKIETVFKSLLKDKDPLSGFKKNPVKIIEKILGVNLPDKQANAIIKGVMEKLSGEGISAVLDKDGDGKVELNEVAGMLGGLMGKKK